MTYGSCHRMCESNVHTCENPSASARLASSITRADGGVVWRTTPISMGRDITDALYSSYRPPGPVTRSSHGGVTPHPDQLAPPSRLTHTAGSPVDVLPVATQRSPAFAPTHPTKLPGGRPSGCQSRPSLRVIIAP